MVIGPAQTAQTGRVTGDTLELLRGVSTATLCTQLRKRGFRSLFMHNVGPLRPDLRLVGQAVTLRYIPVREDLDMTGDFDNRSNKQRLAVELVGPGDVLVIDARGAAGIVTDEAFRDSPTIKTIDLPTYAGGQNANLSNLIHFPSEINVPIACGGVAVLPGDVIVGDAEGIIVIPLALADEVARDDAAQEDCESFIFDKVRAGSSIVGVYPPNEQTLREYEQARGSANGTTGTNGHTPARA